MLRDAWGDFARRAPDLPVEPTLGSRQNVALAALTAAFCEALTDQGVERDYAIELTADVSWRVYAYWGRAAAILTAPWPADPATKLRRRVNTFLRFPFNPPGYRFHDIPEPTGRSLDMLRCPVADYMATQNASDLCVGSWCNLDFALAEMWGRRLERTGSIAGGSDLCDFRFRAVDATAMQAQ